MKGKEMEDQSTDKGSNIAEPIHFQTFPYSYFLFPLYSTPCSSPFLTFPTFYFFLFSSLKCTSLLTSFTVKNFLLSYFPLIPFPLFFSNLKINVGGPPLLKIYLPFYYFFSPCSNFNLFIHPRC